jgi:hypothetical protein
MKRCPKCNEIFTGDLNFCLMDGSPLRAEAAPTVVLPETVINPRQTVPMQQKPEAAPRSASHFFVYATVALVAILLGGGVVFWLKSDSNRDRLAVTPQTQASPNSNEVTQRPTPSASSSSQGETLPRLTDNAVESLISRWEKTQESKDFTSYESCYSYSFQGVLRTAAGRVKTYNFNEWMSTRRQLIKQAGGLDIEVKNLRIRIDGETAIVEFDQYYRSSSYSDWGPKVMTIRVTDQGLKIISEELKASYPL